MGDGGSGQRGYEWRVSAPSEGPVSEDQGGVAAGGWQEPGGYGALALVSGTIGAEGAEGDRVGPALGGEVAAEAEHVRPGQQSQVGELGELAEAEAFGDVAAGVVPDGQLLEAVGGRDTAVEGAGQLSDGEAFRQAA